jgi:hypothetical protein
MEMPSGVVNGRFIPLEPTWAVGNGQNLFCPEHYNHRRSNLVLESSYTRFNYSKTPRRRFIRATPQLQEFDGVRSILAEDYIICRCLRKDEHIDKDRLI